jgi:hypothetical protein
MNANELYEEFLKKYRVIKIEFLKSGDLDIIIKNTLKNQKENSVFVRNVFNEIVNYGNDKDVDISIIDDMKVIWFLGWELYSYTNFSKREVLITPFKLLLMRLPYPNLYPKDMLYKLKKVLTDKNMPAIETLYGKYGIYSIIKTVYKTQLIIKEKKR